MRLSMTLRQQARLATAFAVFVLLLASGLSYWSARQFQAADRRRDVEQRFYSHFAELLSALKDAETGQRGYLLTGSEAYLAPFVGGSGAAVAHLAELHRYGRLDPQHRAALARVDRLTREKLAGLNLAIQVRRNEGLAAAQALLRAGTGRELMDSLRVTIAEVQGAIAADLADSERDGRRLSALMMATIPVVGALAVLFVVVGAMQLGRELRRRESAEASLSASAREIEDLYHHAPCGYHSLDAEARFVRVNQTEADWLGYRRDELLGRRFTDFLTPESQALVAERFPRFKVEGLVEALELEMVRRDGRILPVSLSATVVRDAAGRYLMSRSTLHDISALRAAARALADANQRLEEQVRQRTAALAESNRDLQEAVEELRAAEEELQQQNDELRQSQRDLELSEHRLQTALVHLPQTLFNQDLELRYTWVANPQPGFAVEQVVGRTDAELLGAEAAAEYTALKRRVLETGVGVHQELTLTVRGSEVVFEMVVEPLRDAAGRVIGLTGAALDITTRKWAEDAQRQAHEELQALVAASPQALVAVDGRGRVLSWYGGAERLFGWRAEEVVGRLLPTVPPDQLEAFQEILRQGMAGSTIANHEVVRRRKDGTAVPVTISTAPLHDAKGRITGLVGVYADVTERRRAEEERRAREIAEAANRAKSQFLANMSHELRTPLNAIIGFSELLEDQAFGGLNARQARYVSNVLASGRHLLELINDILDLAKVEAGRLVLEPASFNAGGAIQEVRRIVEPLAMAKRLSLTTPDSDSLPTITADRAKFKQILYNLLSNAIKFTPEGGEVHVTARVLRAPGATGEGALEIAVRDTGIGIHPRDHARVFQEFEQVDSSYAREQPGTGLGLALTRRLVGLHGGTITLASELGQGSTFTVVLPLVPPALRTVTGELPRLPPEGDTRPLVLVVEDDPVAGELLGHYLSANGYAVAHAWNGAQALEAAQSLQPAAITLDILLPDEDGLEVLSRLRTLGETRGIPVVVISITDDRELGLSLGAVDWLVKPVQRDQLLEALEAAVPVRALAQATRVLVVDDHRETVDLLAETLQRRGFAAIRAYGGAEGLELARRERPDAIVLDLVMPGLGGAEVVRLLREDPATTAIPVLVFTYKELSEAERSALDGRIHTIVSKSEAGELLKALQRLARRISGPRLAVREAEGAS